MLRHVYKKRRMTEATYSFSKALNKSKERGSEARAKGKFELKA